MRELGIQKVMKIRVKDTVTKELKVELKRLQESTFTNGQETVFLTNGDGVYSASFDHSKMASISGSNTRISGDLLALQVGSEVQELTNSTLYERREVVTITGNTATTEFIGTGTADEEIKFMYELDSNGNKTSIVLTQGAITASGVFAYDTGTKAITTTSVADGTSFLILYYPTASKLEKISNLAENISYTGEIIADCLFKDVCADKLVLGQIVATKGHISGAFEWALSEGGNPALHDFKVDFLENCADGNLWDILLADEADLL